MQISKNKTQFISCRIKPERTHHLHNKWLMISTLVILNSSLSNKVHKVQSYRISVLANIKSRKGIQQLILIEQSGTVDMNSVV